MAEQRKPQQRKKIPKRDEMRWALTRACDEAAAFRYLAKLAGIRLDGMAGPYRSCRSLRRTRTRLLASMERMRRWMEVAPVWNEAR